MNWVRQRVNAYRTNYYRYYVLTGTYVILSSELGMYDVRSRTFRIYVYTVYTVYTVCHFHAVSRVFRMSVDFLPMVHADCKLHRANRRRYQAAKQPQLNRM